MADFCMDCSIELFGEYFGDLKGIVSENNTIWTICEGCGLTYIDHLGKCVYEGCYKCSKRRSKNG